MEHQTLRLDKRNKLCWFFFLVSLHLWIVNWRTYLRDPIPGSVCSSKRLPRHLNRWLDWCAPLHSSETGTISSFCPHCLIQPSPICVLHICVVCLFCGCFWWLGEKEKRKRWWMHVKNNQIKLSELFSVQVNQIFGVFIFNFPCFVWYLSL